jgi:hypothetical protein
MDVPICPFEAQFKRQTLVCWKHILGCSLSYKCCKIVCVVCIPAAAQAIDCRIVTSGRVRYRDTVGWEFQRAWEVQCIAVSKLMGNNTSPHPQVQFSTCLINQLTFYFHVWPSRSLCYWPMVILWVEKTLQSTSFQIVTRIPNIQFIPN